MAKMFYNMDETKAALGKSEDQVKELSKQGRLREFRDGARPMFKTDQVEHLKAELAAAGPDSSDALELSPADSGIALSMDEHKDASSSASGISLADSGIGSGTGSRAGGSVSGSATAPNLADDTALASDLGLAGSVSGMPSSGRLAGSAAGMSGSHGTRAGLDAFGNEEPEKVDPSAQTSIAPGLNADQLNIESVGSGSGLLDLTNERDDTSLGAELLDEIAPSASGVRRPPSESVLSASALGGSSMGGSAASASGTGVGLSDPRSGGALAARSAPTVAEAPDPLAPAFGLAAIGAAAACLFAAFALMCGLAGDQPDLLKKMGSSAEGGFSFWLVLGLVFTLPLLLFIGGAVTGRTSRK